MRTERAGRKLQWMFLAALLLLPGTSGAQQKGAIELKTAAEVEVVEQNAKGEKITKRQEATLSKIVPGDVVIFTTTYTNTGREPATAVVIINPVPEHMAYVGESASGTDTRIEFSVDGGKTYGAPDKLTVMDAQGKPRKADAADYTHFRWTRTKPLPAGGTGAVSFRAKLK